MKHQNSVTKNKNTHNHFLVLGTQYYENGQSPLEYCFEFHNTINKILSTPFRKNFTKQILNEPPKLL